MCRGTWLIIVLSDPTLRRALHQGLYGQLAVRLVVTFWQLAELFSLDTRFDYPVPKCMTEVPERRLDVLMRVEAERGRAVS